MEVTSPSERTSGSMRKVETYLHHGVREVWQVFSTLRQMVACNERESRRFAAAESLTTPLLPGFELTVASLFED